MMNVKILGNFDTLKETKFMAMVEFVILNKNYAGIESAFLSKRSS